MEFCMSDYIRNKTISETKIAKIAKKLPKSNILKHWLQTLHNGNVFANTEKQLLRFYNV